MSIPRILIALVVGGLFAVFVAANADADADGLNESAREGQRLYEYYCLSCHGEKGKGDGETSKVLTVKPTNLRKLAKKNGGDFPLERVQRSIDGRERTPAHGTAMPIWGIGFQDPASDVYQEGEVQRRIDCLIEYIQTLQK